MSLLEDFEASIVEVTVLQVIQGKYKDESKRNAINRACVVLLVSHFEGFLKTLTESFVEAIGNGEYESRSIPYALRELHTLPKLEAILSSGDVTQRAVLLKKSRDVMPLWKDDARPPKGTLRAEILSREVTSADSTTIDRVFRLMGAGLDVCDGELDLTGGMDGETVNIRLGLRDIVQCRNDIAHGDADRKPTHDDVQRYLRTLSALARRLEKKTRTLVGDIQRTRIN